MNAREKIEAALAKARADREKASEDRARAGANWRKQDDASVTYDKVRSNWVQADAAWNNANAEIEKLTAALAEVERTESLMQSRAALEAAVARAKIERDKADTALALVAKARAEREKEAAAAQARVERRSGDAERRKPNSDRRQATTSRRHSAKTDNTDSPGNTWSEAVKNYNRADAEWNKARAALAALTKKR